jgi:3-isopropylmalate/(R)-2-methylmalate dehydratase small subunit
MERLERLDAVALPIRMINCDTDQIVPAEYLQKPRSEDFGKGLFGELRRGKDFVLNREPFRPARIVVANRNFGCGSSREHAVWALYDYGIRAAIAPSFGDIFFANCLKNGLLPIALPEDVVLGLLDALEASPGAKIAVDLPAQTVTLPDGSSHSFDVDAFAKLCLVSGMDELEYTLSRSSAIDAFERARGQDTSA